MGFKCVVVLLACFYAAQVLSVPVQPAVEKGFILDIYKVVVTVEDFIASCNNLYRQVLASSNNVITTIVTSVDSILKQLGDLGLDPEEIQAMEDLAQTCVRNIRGIVTGLQTDITRVISVLKDVIKHRENEVLLARDLIKLRRAIKKTVEDFSTALERIVAQLVELKNSVISVLANHTGEIVENILSDIAAIEDTLVNEYNAVISAFDATIAAANAALAALDQLFS